jgi:hypothetical protein
LPRWLHEGARAVRCGFGSLFIAGVAFFGAGTEGHSMSALDSSRYFQDAKTARFVDDVQKGNAASVQAAIAAGQDPNAKGADGIRPIHFVFAARTADVLEVLLKAGADPNAKAPNGNTPLHYAVQQRTPDFTQVLLRYRADPRLPGEGEKPVLYVALSSPVATTILPLLISAGADVNHRWGGYPPLQAAMVQQDWASAAILLQAGADAERQTQQGETAAQTFCRLLQRMRPVGPARKQIAAVGDKLLPGLPPECAARLGSFR